MIAAQKVKWMEHTLFGTIPPGVPIRRVCNWGKLPRTYWFPNGVAGGPHPTDRSGACGGV